MKTSEILSKLNTRFSSNPFLRLMEFRVVRARKDGAVLTVTCNENTLSHQGSLYGGVISFAADVAMWVAMLVTGLESKVVTTDLSVHYLDRFSKGKATFEAKILRNGKRMIMAEVDVYNDEKILAAHVTGSFLKL